MKRKLRTRVLTILIAVSMLTAMPFETYAAINYHEWIDTATQVAYEIGKAKFKFDRMGCSKGSFSKAKKLKGKKRVMNCADYMSWSLVRLGLLKPGKRFYAKGTKVYGSGAKTIKGKNFVIIKVKGKPRASTLVKKGILKPGDLISQADGSGHHMQLYAGKDSKGRIQWYAIGKKYQVVKGYINAKRVMNTRKDKRAHHNNPRVAMIIRIKGMSYEDSFKITTSAENGTITASTKVKWAKNKTISYAPEKGYELKSVTVDGKAVDIAKYPTSYTFKAVKKAHSIKVVFGKPEFTVTATAENGTVTGDGKYETGSSATVSVTPDEGYKLDKILVNGEEVALEEGQTSYTIAELTADVEIQFICVKVDEPAVEENPDDSTAPSNPAEGTDPAEGVDPVVEEETI